MHPLPLTARRKLPEKSLSVFLTTLVSRFQRPRARERAIFLSFSVGTKSSLKVPSRATLDSNSFFYSLKDDLLESQDSALRKCVHLHTHSRPHPVCMSCVE